MMNDMVRQPQIKLGGNVLSCAVENFLLIFVFSLIIFESIFSIIIGTFRRKNLNLFFIKSFIQSLNIDQIFLPPSRWLARSRIVRHDKKSKFSLRFESAQDGPFELGVHFGGELHDDAAELRHLLVNELAEAGRLAALLPHRLLQPPHAQLQLLVAAPQPLAILSLSVADRVVLLHLDLPPALLIAAAALPDGLLELPSEAGPFVLELLRLFPKRFLICLNGPPLVLDEAHSLFYLEQFAHLIAPLLQPRPQLSLRLALGPQLFPQRLHLRSQLFDHELEAAVFVGEGNAFLEHFDVGAFVLVELGDFLLLLFLGQVEGDPAGTAGGRLGGGVGVDVLLRLVVRGEFEQPLCPLLELFQIFPAHYYTGGWAAYHLICMLRQLLLMLLAVAAAAYQQAEGLLVLSEADFASAVKEHSYLFVKFYTPWCGHCKKLAPVFVELAAQLAQTHPNIRLAKVDLDENKALQAQLKIQSFPTLIFFKDGVPMAFGGSRTKDFMLQWLSKKVQEPLIAVAEERLAALKTDGNVNIVFFGDLKSPQGATLLNIAKNDDYNMYYRVEASKPSVEIYRPFGEPVRNDVIDYNLKSWISLYDRPFVYDYDDRTSKELFTEKRNGIILFVPTSEASLSLIAAFREASEDLKLRQKKRLIFTQIEASTEAYSGLSDYIKVNPALHPIVYVKNAEKLKYVFGGKSGEITAARILEFIKLVESGKARKYKMDEETRPKAAAGASEL